MKSICVFLGAKTGHGTRLSLLATELGKEIALCGSRLIYGGSSHGLMGILAQAVIDSGGQVTGIMPKVLIEQEQPLDTINQLIITETMQERKLLMQQHSDGFIVMPGGLGTLEEAFDVWNAIKIGVIDKPIVFLNLDGYYDGLFTFVVHCEFHGFVSSSHRKIQTLSPDPKKLLEALFEFSGSTI
jgi:uncharacterized protein (TIGR00730 family)